MTLSREFSISFFGWLNDEFWKVIQLHADHSGLSNTWIVGSNPTRGMDVCVHLFCVYVVLCVGSDLTTG
jgi:hypothetical protein